MVTGRGSQRMTRALFHGALLCYLPLLTALSPHHRHYSRPLLTLGSQREMKMTRTEKAASMGSAQAVRAATMRRSAGNLPKTRITCARARANLR